MIRKRFLHKFVHKMSPAGLKILTCAIQFYVFKWFIFCGAFATTENNYMKESVEPKPGDCVVVI